MAYLRSPIFYMGNKFKLLDFILPLFPNKCNIFYDLFGGSAVVSLNYRNKCNKVIYNDFNQNIVGLVKMLLENDPMDLNDYFEKKKEEYGLLRDLSLNGKGLPKEERIKLFKEIEEGFLKLRKDYNESKVRDYRDLYLLSCYSINHLMRFNSNSDFNVSVGTCSYNSTILQQIINFHNVLGGGTHKYRIRMSLK